MAKVGDIVRYLNATGGGRIVKINGQIAYVDEDGFETPVLIRECVVVGETPAKRNAEVNVAPSVLEMKPAAKGKVPEVQEVPVPEETPEGEQLNIVLAYEPHNLHQLQSSVFDAVLVNDSNYYIYYIYATRADNSREWIARSAGIIEPATQLLLGEVTRDDLPEMDRIAVQLIAFKRDKSYRIKAPMAIETALDTTKFAKLHCFHANTYFDSPVIAIDIVKNDVPCRPMVIDTAALERSLMQKRNADARRDTIKTLPKHSRSNKPSNNEPHVVDLHISELLDSTAGLSNSDMLEVQLKEFRRVMDSSQKEKGRRIIFIHGKGEGVLRKALLEELRKRYPQCEAQDASFREYGFGATLIKIH